jgi:hypothetical protein
MNPDDVSLSGCENDQTGCLSPQKGGLSRRVLMGACQLALAKHCTMPQFCHSI